MQEEYWGLSGFSIELWENLARELDLDSSFKVYPNVKDLLTAVEEKQMDMGIAAITINSERAQRVDFSYPIFSGGLQIMVRHPRLERSTWSFSKDLISSALPKLLALIVLIIVAMAHVVWLIERFHHDPIISSAYFPGIFQALWWTATGLVGQADTVPKGIPAKLIALFWMFASVGLVTYFTAAFTTALTVQQLQGSIQGLADLPGHTVATTAGSTAAKFLQGRKIKTLEWDRLEEVYAALMDREADAVVFDSGVLAYHANHDGKNLVKLVGEVFKPEDYAIAVAPGNPLGKEIDVALLKLKEDGTYDLLYDKYFKQE
jgi:polar amino acid transport system substrate-binding protein